MRSDHRVSKAPTTGLVNLGAKGRLEVDNTKSVHLSFLVLGIWDSLAELLLRERLVQTVDYLHFKQKSSSSEKDPKFQHLRKLTHSHSAMWKQGVPQLWCISTTHTGTPCQHRNLHQEVRARNLSCCSIETKRSSPSKKIYDSKRLILAEFAIKILFRSPSWCLCQVGQRYSRSRVFW